MDKTKDIEYSYSELGNAIVIQAANDYRKALVKCRSRDKLTPEAETLEKFFRSDWCCELTTVDGELIISRIKKEVFGK